MTDWSAIIDAPGGKTRLSRSGLGDDHVVDQSPASLLDQARKIGGHGITLDGYSLARVIASELGSGSVQELLAIGDADLNRARAGGKSVFEHVTGGTGRYGRQKAPRPVSTARDPYVRQLRAALALLGGGARGIARGATMYFDPKVQLALWRQGKAVHPLVVLERWTYDLPWETRTRDAEGRQVATLKRNQRGRSQRQWIGTVGGIDAYELMLFAPRTSEAAQDAAYEAARAVIESKGADQPDEVVASDDRGLLRCAAIGAAAALAIGGVV